MIQVLVVDGHELVRRGLREMLAATLRAEVTDAVATCAEASEAVARAGRIDVYVVASDIDREDLQALRRAAPSDVALIVVLRGTEPNQLAAGAGLRADGYVFESELTVPALERVLLQTLERQLPMPSQLSTWLIACQRATESDRVFLSHRERQVLELVAEGRTNRQIARALEISEHGVKHHVGNILAKMRAPNRALAVALAFKDGLLDAR